MNPIHIFFHWPDGGVWSNILASIIWTVPALIFSHHKLKKHITKQHQELKNHITAEHKKSRLHLEKRVGNYEH